MATATFNDRDLRVADRDGARDQAGQPYRVGFLAKSAQELWPAAMLVLGLLASVAWSGLLLWAAYSVASWFLS